MPDTERTKAAILALLADNAQGDISPQDMRDAFVSTWMAHGEMSITTPAATTISVNGTWYQIAGTYALSANSPHNFSMGTNGRLQYDGAEQRVFHCGTSFSLTSAGNNVVYEMALAVDSVIWTPSVIDRKIGTGADVGSSALHGIVVMNPGSYLSVMVRQTSAGTDNPTFSHVNLFAVGMIM